MSEPPTTLTMQQIVDFFDRTGVSCDNCDARIVARGGSLGDHHGVTKSEGEGETLCGFCAGAELTDLRRQLEAAETELERRAQACIDLAKRNATAERESRAWELTAENAKLREARALKALEAIKVMANTTSLEPYDRLIRIDQHVTAALADRAETGGE